jgi:competence protein ComEC
LHEVLKPEVAILSVGENRFGHPTERILRILASTGAVVFRTDIDGAVSVQGTIDGLSIGTGGKLAR